MGNNNLILVDIFDNEIGVMEKLQAHLKPVLHRAFSIFLVDGNKMLIQKRAYEKYHSGGLWANACCSHPRPNLTLMESAKQRLKQELNVSDVDLTELFSFTYLSKYNDNLYEYEYDHVLVGKLKEQAIHFNKEEICDYKWIDIDELSLDLVKNPQNYATWFLICAPKVISVLKLNKH